MREEETQARATSSITMTVASASAAGAAVLLGDVDGVQVGGGEGVQRLLREAGLLIDRGRVRGDLRLGERTHRLTEHLVLLGRTVQVEIGRTRQDSHSPCS